MNLIEEILTSDRLGKLSLGTGMHSPSPSINYARICMLFDAIKNKKTVYKSSHGGAVEPEQVADLLKIVDSFKEKFHLLEMGSDVISKYNKIGLRDNIGNTKGQSFDAVFLDSELIVSVGFTGKECDIEVYGLDQEKVAAVLTQFSPLLKKKSQRKGRACTLLKGADGIYVSDLGAGGTAMNKENYVSAVIDDYNFVAKDLASATPRGRLVILDGPPGTGKTYFVRGLINEVENSVFLIVPSSLVSHISDPSFMPAIISLHEDEGVPIILVLEDADIALLPRGMDTMSTISDLLNFADGIVGNIIDFRIIATTNAKKMEIEPALLRKGRLSRNIHIGKLPREKAIEVFERITQNKLAQDTKWSKALENEMVLADVYDLAAEYKLSLTDKNK